MEQTTTPWLPLYLQPLGLVAVSRRPSVDLALFVQTGFRRLPSEHVHVDGPEDARGRDLVVLNVARFHSQRLGAACHRQKNSRFVYFYFYFSLLLNSVSTEGREGGETNMVEAFK